jgi:hypothetical protein
MLDDVSGGEGVLYLSNSELLNFLSSQRLLWLLAWLKVRDGIRCSGGCLAP